VDTVRFRGGAGAVPGRVGCASIVGIECCESGVPKGTERFQTGHEAAGLGKGAPWMELDAFLQVPTVERFTPYLSAIRLQGEHERLEFSVHSGKTCLSSWSASASGSGS
jgi:hypothetical protein